MHGNKTAEKFMTILSQWADRPDAESDNFITFSRNWLDLQSRGGLFKVNDVYKFFRSMEYATRSCIQVSNMQYLKNENILGNVIATLKGNKYVLAMWKKIVDEELDSCSLLLLEEVIKSFAKMRCEAFVRVYLIIRRENEASIAQKGQKGLRKELVK